MQEFNKKLELDSPMKQKTDTKLGIDIEDSILDLQENLNDSN